MSHRRLIIGLVLWIGSVMGGADVAAHRATTTRQDLLCFAETGQCIDGRFREYWEQHGGVAMFGFPLTPEYSETTPEGTFMVQYFERVRFESHPELAAPYDVLLGRLGDTRLRQEGQDWTTLPQGQSTSTCTWFAQTGHSVCEPFKTFWEQQGLTDLSLTSYERSLALFGLPISEPSRETNAAGDEILVQWFERARFEYAPTFPEPFNIMLGLLGAETRNPPTAAQPIIDPALCADVPATLNAIVEPANCVVEGTVITFDIYGFRPNETITYWLVMPDGDLDGPEQSFTVGVSGAIVGLDYDTTGMTPGIWTWYFRGEGSDHRSTLPFKVVPRP